jgi:MFS family permease
MAAFMVIMPALSFLAAKYLNLHGKHSDFVMSKGTGILSTIGFAAIALAPTPSILIFGQIILSMGMGFMVNTRSLATALVLPDHVGTLYSALAITQSAGMLVAGPLFANLFRVGLHLGNAWLGLPFLQASLFFIIAVVAVWRIRLEPSRLSDEEQESSAE